MVETVGQWGVAVVGIIVDGVITGGVFHESLNRNELDCVILDATQNKVHELDCHYHLQADHLLEIY